MKRLFLRTAALLLLVLPCMALGSSEEEMEAARERILERLPEMENLWNRGLTGESNEGFVAARSSLNRSQIAMIQDENRDRLTLYSYVAARTGADLFAVGRERAILISKMAKNGLWIQEGDGDWKRK